MINFPFVSLPEYYTRLLVSNIQNTPTSNTNLELYINENRDLNMLVRRIFTDIDNDGFLGKIIQISGWQGIRNRLAAVYIEYALTGQYPEVANLSLINDLVTTENKLRHFTNGGFSRSFLLAFYAKMAAIQFQKDAQDSHTTPMILTDQHIEYMKLSKSKSVRIDWLMIQLIQFDFLLGQERMTNILRSGARYDALYSMLLSHEQKALVDNCLRYAASINDKDFILSNTLQ